jgi:hypothetical protein
MESKQLYEIGPSTIIECILFIMVIDYPDLKYFTLEDICNKINKSNWCNGNLTIDRTTEEMNINESLFYKVNGKYILNKKGLEQALNVNYA